MAVLIKYEFQEIVQMTYDYICEQCLPKIQKTVYGTDFVFYSTFKKWNCIIDFWVSYNSNGKIIERSLVAKIYEIGKDLRNNIKPEKI